jgi:hypothetical protein
MAVNRLTLSGKRDKAGGPEQRRHRLAEQLRANLAKRKAQMRARQEAAPIPPKDVGTESPAKG